jgi:hypothetical protein
MHEVDVPAAAVALSALPTLGICAQHGHPATGSKPRTFATRTPVWVVVLAVVSLPVGAVVALVLRKTVHGPVPVCHACTNARRTYVGTVVLGWAAAVVLVGVAVGTANDGLAVLGALVVVGALVASFTGDAFRTGGTLSDDQHWVALRRVHPTFTQAVQLRLQEATMPPSYLHAMPPDPRKATA